MATINNAAFPLPGIILCSKCNREVTLFDPAGSAYVTCPSCLSYLQLNRNQSPVTHRTIKTPSLSPILKLGTTGILKDEEYKVIAFLEKTESGTTYSWREYILYSFNKGYVTLAEFDGHWSFIVDQNFYPDFKEPFSFGDSVNFKDSEYKLFNKYTPYVIGMSGETDWDVVNDTVKAKEFIAPPFMVVKEETNNSVFTTAYYQAEYIKGEEIAGAFKLDISTFPSKAGIGAIEPSPYYEKWKNAFQITGIAIILILLFQLLTITIKPEKELFQQNFTITPVSGSTDNTFKSFITPSFLLDDASSNLEFFIASAISNSWLETTIVLVNEKNNRTWEISKGIEYYHGYEDGESWTEGSTTETILLSAIPAGKYHLNVYPAAGSVSTDNLYIKATTNVVMWRNIVLTVLALLLYPAFCWYMMRRFEKKRWENSDYSPFVTGN